MKAIAIILIVNIIASIAMICVTVMAFLDHFDNN